LASRKSVAQDGPDPIDIHVGLQIKLRRKQIHMSQERLADGLRLTFQQVQKYEKGANRVSASMLFRAAQILGVRPDYFFAGLEDQGGDDGVSFQTLTKGVLAAVPQIAMIDGLSRERQLVLGRIIEALANVDHPQSTSEPLS
jgi:transcriptional regulator with XRE-family HTH domain